MTKIHWKKQFNYDYLGSYSLEPGKDMILTIKSIGKEMVTGSNGKKEECVVCKFSENVKPMILNKTNCKIIENVYGTPYIDDWVGKKIQIYAARVRAFGDEVEALRIRKKVPQTNKPELTPDMSAWNKAIEHLSKNGKIEDIRKKYKLSEENADKLMEAVI